MGKILKILGGVVAIIGLAVGAAFYMTAGLTDTADAFFKALKSQDASGARSYLAAEANKTIDDETLQKLMKAEAFATYREANFPNRRVSGNRGELGGTLTTASGGVVPIQMVLVQEGGGWKVYYFKTG